MALPSVVTLGSLAFVVAAGVGYAATLSASASPSSSPASHSSLSGHSPRLPVAVKHIPTPNHAATTPKKQRTDVIPHVLVVVYNNTGISGLAASKAAILEGAGWNVASTDNWYGTIPANTVYYPPHMRPAASKLARVLHLTRLRPSVSPMQFDRLTVILASG